MEKKILYILDSFSVSNEILNKFKTQKNIVILALNIELIKFFEKNDIKILSEENLLIYEDYENIDNVALEFSRNWFLKGDLEKILNYHNTNLGFLLQNELFQNLLKYIHRTKLIQKVLEKIDPDLVITTFSEDILDKIPYNVCISKKIKTEIIKDFQTVPKGNKFDKVNFAVRILGKNLDLSLSRKQFTYAKKVFEMYWNIRYRFSNLLKTKQTQNNKSVLFIDFNLIWHESFLRLLSQKKFDLYFLNNRRPTIWNQYSLKIANDLRIKKIHLPNSHYEKNFFNALICSIKSNFDKKFMNEYFQLNDFDFWSIFRPKLENILQHRLENLIVLINKVEDLLDVKKFDLVWTLDDWGDDRTIVMVCQSKKIPICMLLAGSLAIKKPEGRRWILPSIVGERIADKLCVWGDNDKKNCIEANIDMRKISVGGAPRYDQLFLRNISSNEDYILILTGGMPSTQNSYFLSTSVILRFETLLRNTLQEVKKFNKKIIIKRHPTQGPQEIINLQNMFSEIIPEAIVLKEADTIDLISKASLIISAQSTVIEESIILDKPIILIPYTKNNNEIPYVSSGAVFVINNTTEINKIIHNCLFDKNIKEQLKQGRKLFLEKTFSYQGNAAERHYEIMKEILKKD